MNYLGRMLAVLVMSGIFTIGGYAAANENQPESTPEVKCGNERIAANSYKIFEFKFYRGERGAVVMKGDGDTDLDLYVYNPDGRLIAKDEHYSDEGAAGWFVSTTGTYTVKVVNRGRVYNDFRICIGADAVD